ncbi:TIGR02391 family protein [Helicobacter sp. MIT 01-3238]|uniref:TIGR02391 family protein n=1 Tax=Helicobacter sp. MIT 01-3238 TaxID=398627 RepID=UPI000E1E546D|nr:TIGR02391 family protein [Helicobacter sp. MIT 01-3238]RDU55167.1 TIGR02391 family protein [Helicobacter sp. MIT 01-3238]
MSDLEMSFDPHTIEHLGIKMYSRVANAIAELVANAYDADADTVHIKLYDKDEFKIIVEDDGIGMSFNDINSCFLRIGRKRRKTDEGRKTLKGRTITGKKGLGKLALFGIGKSINIITKKEDSDKQISFNLDWDEIITQNSGSYRPHYTIKKDELTNHGTTIILSTLKRKTPFDIQSISNALSRLFNFMNTNFKIKINCNDGNIIDVGQENKYDNLNIQFQWDMQDLCNEIESNYIRKCELKGKILSTQKPVVSDYRGITLYANGRLVNSAGFFGISEAPVALSYITGWIEADFIDEEAEELISTDRQSLNWDIDQAQELQVFLFKIIQLVTKKWNAQRKQENIKKTKEKTGVDIKSWTNTMPNKLKNDIEKIIEKVVEKPELDEEIASDIVKQLHEIIPKYPYYHFRELHKEVKQASESGYQSKDYYKAFLEAAKRYVNAVAKKSDDSLDGDPLMSKVFSEHNYKLDVVKRYSNNSKIRDFVLKDIRRGQMFLSKGVVAGGRNVLSHTEYEDLKKTELFTEKDCLDLLSLLSHLFKRLEESEQRK